MAIAHMSPLYPKTVKGSKAGGEKLIDKYDVAAQYIHHVLKIVLPWTNLSLLMFQFYGGLFSECFAPRP